MTRQSLDAKVGGPLVCRSSGGRGFHIHPVSPGAWFISSSHVRGSVMNLLTLVRIEQLTFKKKLSTVMTEFT
jgi:DNA primase catalytic subunit